VQCDGKATWFIEGDAEAGADLDFFKIKTGGQAGAPAGSAGCAWRDADRILRHKACDRGIPGAFSKGGGQKFINPYKARPENYCRDCWKRLENRLK